MEGRNTTEVCYDRTTELKAFDETKAGVKGLVDAGITKLPPIFIDNNLELDHKAAKVNGPRFGIPVIDLQGIDGDETRRRKVIEEVERSCEEWGFFQVLNHGIPSTVLDEVIHGVRRFFEQDVGLKKPYYSRDLKRKVYYNANFDLFQAAVANWRDTLYCVMAPHPPLPQEIPEACREIIMEYSKHVKKLGSSLFELLSEALGLNRNRLTDMNCTKGLLLLGHYYPACPEPQKAIGSSSHSGFLTVLLQDQIGGLEVLHHDQWVDVSPVPGGIIVNLGDLTQLITNDKFKSVKHRVLANDTSSRISIASFFRTQSGDEEDGKCVYGPIKELISEGNPPKYRETTPNEFVARRHAVGLDNDSTLAYFRL
ncbi:hypothetical protein Nepgr_028410 [Nepenthes gracilis]|uniref:Fe2OG dioxygenase domain-containing protein n=1 Tax=Nepenthes gracilis TaxID=150966 RepID=A0AAD3TDM5_NEPGR|nr:hypothetical protein Nepgr_028410 [Nepenthes gracilis]